VFIDYFIEIATTMATQTCLYCGVEGHNCVPTKCPKIRDLHARIHNCIQPTTSSKSGDINYKSLEDIHKIVDGFTDEEFIFACIYKRKSVPPAEGAPTLGTHASILKLQVKPPVEPFKAELIQWLNENYDRNLRLKKMLLKERIMKSNRVIKRLQKELNAIVAPGEARTNMNIMVSVPGESACSSINCPMCYEDTPYHFVATTACKHQFCIGCTYEQIDRSSLPFPPCALCRTLIKTIYVNTNFAKNTIESVTK